MEALFLEFVNSSWTATHGNGGDVLRDLTQLNSWLEHWHMRPLAALPPALSQALITLRTQLSEVIASLASGAAPSAEMLAQFNAHLERATLHYALEPTASGCQAVLRPAANPVDALLPDIVRSFAQFIADHDPARLRVCGNPDCRGVFYDETRNASRRWCGPTCASLIKVRRYRARHR